MAEGLQQPLLGECAHGQAYSKSRQSIYVSPSILYASHPVYATLAKVDHYHWIQTVLEVRVRPNSFEVVRSTLRKKHWPSELLFDPSFPNNRELEWLLEQPKDIVVTGVMVREMGPNVDPSLFGPVVSTVTDGDRGAEYGYTKCLEQYFRRRGYLLKC